MNWSYSQVSLLCAAFQLISLMCYITMIRVPGTVLAEYAESAPIATPLRRAALLCTYISLTCLAREQCTFTRRSMSSETSLQSYDQHQLVPVYEKMEKKKRKSWTRSGGSFWWVCVNDLKDIHGSGILEQRNYLLSHRIFNTWYILKTM